MTSKVIRSLLASELRPYPLDALPSADTRQTEQRSGTTREWLRDDAPKVYLE